MNAKVGAVRQVQRHRQLVRTSEPDGPEHLSGLAGDLGHQIRGCCAGGTGGVDLDQGVAVGIEDQVGITRPVNKVLSDEDILEVEILWYCRIA